MPRHSSVDLPFVQDATFFYDDNSERTIKEFSLIFRGPRPQGNLPLTLLPGTNRQLFDLCISFASSLQDLGLPSLTLKVHTNDHHHYGWVPGGSDLYWDLDSLVQGSSQNTGVFAEIEHSLNAASVFIEPDLSDEDRVFLIKHNYTDEDRLHHVGSTLTAIAATLPPNVKPDWLTDDYVKETRARIDSWYERFGPQGESFNGRWDSPRYYWFIDDVCSLTDAPLQSSAPSIVLGVTFVGHGWKAGLYGQPGQALFAFHALPLVHTVVHGGQALRLPGSLYPTLQALNKLFWNKAWRYICQVLA